MVMVKPAAPTSPRFEPLPALHADAVAWLAFAAAFIATGLAAAPAMGWLDSAELVAAARELGSIHPPGHPAWLSLATVADLVPLGPYALRIAWLSSFFAGASAWLAVRIARFVAADQGDARLSSTWAVGAVCALVASGSLWQVAARAEVYTLALATNLWMLYAALRAGRVANIRQVQPRLLLVGCGEFALAASLGLLNHHYVTLFLLPACAVAMGPALNWLWRRQRNWLLALFGIGLWLGLAYFSLSLRALADTEMRWGNPATIQGLIDTATAKQFQKSVVGVQVDVAGNGAVLFGMVMEQMGIYLAALGLLGLAFGVLLRSRVQLVLWLALVGGLATKALMQIDTRNPDDHGYILLSVAILSLGVAQLPAVLFGQLGLFRTWSAQRRWRGSLALGAAFALLACWQVHSLWQDPACNLAQLRAPERIDNAMRATIAPGGLLLSNYYGLAFNEQAFRIAEGRRPDIVAPHLTFRTSDTDKGTAYQRWFIKRYPQLRDLAQGAMAFQRAPIGNELARAETQPVYAEIDPASRIPAPMYHFDGLINRLLPEAERALDYSPSDRLKEHIAGWDAVYLRLGTDALADGPTKSLLIWQHALQAAHALQRGWMQVAAEELKRARRLNPQDRILARLDSRLAALDAAWRRADTTAYRNLWQKYLTMDFDQLVGE